MTIEAKTDSWNQVIAGGFIFPPIHSSTTLQDAVNMATIAVDRHLANSPAVRAYLAELPKGPGTDCPDSPLDELVRYVADQKGMIDKSDPALSLRFLTTFIVPVFEFEREAVFKALNIIEDRSLAEFFLFEDCANLSRATDRFWAKWFAAITIPYQSLDEAGKKQYEERVRDTLAQYDYTVFDYDPRRGCTNRRTWAEAFPEEISEILELLYALEQTQIPELADYFAVLYEAYGCTDINKLEELWTRVDEAWIRIPNTARLVPVHGMESGYEHPFGVSPEFRLEVRTSEGRDMIESRRRATLSHAAAFRLSNEFVSAAVQKLEHIDISVFITALRAGVCLNFRYAGQSVPNRQQVLAEGGRIFLDKSAAPRAAKRYVDNVMKHCAPATAHMLAPLITETALLAHTATHEYAHPVGRTAKSDAKLGSEGMKLCEEAKATLLGILADEHRDPSPAHRLEIIATTAGRVLRFMDATELESATFAPYVRENLAAATMLFETGVMTLGADGVEVNLKAAKSPAWFKALREFNRGVLNAYQAEDKTALERLTERYCNREHPRVAALIAWVNR
ncbi:MAG: hypothetical protein Q7S95_02275 [bacterium]|nr:hypothetical protein [bacterium]